MPRLRIDSLPTRRIGRRIWEFGTLDSTNTAAALFDHDTANDGLVVTAMEQTAGRGRLGRKWSTQPGQAVLLSVLLFPPERFRKPVILTAFAAVAVCETIHETTGLHPAIKWPNDVLIQGKKVSGILVEHRDGVVIGIGLNVHSTAADLQAAELPDAGSLAIFADAELSRERIQDALILQLDNCYSRLLTDGESNLLTRWQGWLSLLGQLVHLRSGRESAQGRLSELNFDGLTVVTAEVPPLRYVPEAVESLTLTVANPWQPPS